MKKIIFIGSILSILFCSCKKHEDIKVTDELKYSTDFSADDHTWFQGPNNCVVSEPPGYYKMLQSEENYQTWGLAPYSTINYNYSVSADVQLLVQNSGCYGSAGLIYNFQDIDHYSVFYVYNDGQFFVFKHDKGFTTLIKKTLTNAYKTGQSNRLEVRQSGGSASFLINSTVVGSCSSSRGESLVSAGVALSTTSAPYFSPVQGNFDNVMIKKIQ